MVSSIIKNENKCTGCAACYNVCPEAAIAMNLKDGFYAPVIDMKKCISCNKCISVCPQNMLLCESGETTTSFACKNRDDEVRIKSASGGVFSILAEQILNPGRLSEGG